MNRDSLTQKELKEQLAYDPDTGIFTRLKVFSTCIKVGDPAGRLQEHTGYIRVTINKIEYKAHRLAWLYVHGVWPENVIDHINGDKTDNRICNLRDVTVAVNSRNRLSHREFGVNSNNQHGYAGVSFDKTYNRYRADCKMYGKNKFLGHFLTAKQAGAAYFLYVRKIKEAYS